MRISFGSTSRRGGLPSRSRAGSESARVHEITASGPGPEPGPRPGYKRVACAIAAGCRLLAVVTEGRTAHPAEAAKEDRNGS